jgi:hypothetical protein
MLPGGTDPGYRALLAAPHTPYTRVEVWREGVRIDEYGEEGLPFSNGAISATLASQVTRQLSIAVDESLYPASDSALLAPYGNELRVFQGIKPGAGVPYEWQTFRGKIQDSELGDFTVDIRAADRASEVKESGFLRPDNSIVNDPVTQELRRLITDGVPTATFGTFDNITNLTPQLTWEQDRGSACDDLSKGSGSFWYALANGDFVMRFIPWTVDQTAVVELADGEGGSISTASPSKSRENVYNSIVVIGERTDGTAPVYAVAQDLDPTSPTYVGGAFGVKTMLIRAQAAVNQAQALSLARDTLRYAKALTQSWQLTTTFDPSMELGDCIGITARGLQRDVQVVAAFQFPLIATRPMAVSTVALRPGALEG